jgi:hypothetical protein
MNNNSGLHCMTDTGGSRVRAWSVVRGILVCAIIVCSSCDLPTSFDQNVKQKQKHLDELTQEVEKSVSPDKIVTCGREVIAAVPANKYSNGTYWVPKTELPSCWPSLGLDNKEVVNIYLNGADGDGPCLVVRLKMGEEEIVLFVYPQGISPSPVVLESPYGKKWRDGLYVLYSIRP